MPSLAKREPPLCPNAKSKHLYDDVVSGRRYIDCSSTRKSCSPLTVISLFTGAGGLDLGLELAGFETLGCIEVDKDCRETLKHNRHGWKLIDGSNHDLPGDIRGVNPHDVLAIFGLKRGELGLVVGGPPCQPFSNLGKKEGQHDCHNGDLYAEFTRMVDGLLPRGFIFENVEGFAQQKHEGIRNFMFSEFKRLGYRMTSHVLCSADYGDPQVRKRYVILGIRGIDHIALPMPEFFETNSKAIQFYGRIGREFVGQAKSWRNMGESLAQIPIPRLTRSDCIQMGVSEVVAMRMSLVGAGENFKVLPIELLPNCWKSGKHQGQDTFGRLRADKPSVTIRTSAYNVSKGRFIHPFEDRGLNTAEMAALQSFPFEYEFKCVGKPTLVGIGKMIGNAVPIRLARALGQAMALQLP